jgi:inosine-uridine nucleoside N-ribohydrolase
MLRFGLTTSVRVGADALVRPGGEVKRARTRTFAAALISCALLCLSLGSSLCPAQTSAPPPAPQKVIIDTDIGDDIDDAFALALALRSPELQILGVTTTFGDTELRAKLASRFLSEAGRPDISVIAGAPTQTKSVFTQRPYAEGGHLSKTSQTNAVDFLLDQIRRYPNEITLIGIGPEMNIGSAIDRDPATFRQLKRVVIMCGSVYRGYDDHVGYGPPVPPDPEWNIVNDIPSAQKLFASGVPLYVMPVDSTELKLDEVKRAFLFSQGTPLTDALTLLYHQWGHETPTLFDVMAVSYAMNPALCPSTRLRIRVDEKGFTRPESGPPNAQVCLESNPDQFFQFVLKRLAVR